MRCFRQAALGCLSLLTTSTLLVAQSDFRGELNLGTAAFREARYEDAIRHFQAAASIRPQNGVAHLYLATAYAEQYIPGVESPDNVHYAEASVSEYQKVLEINPKSWESLKGVAYIYLQRKKFADAKAFYGKAIDLDPGDPETYYSIGVIDWTLAYIPRTELRERLALKPDAPLPIGAPECWELRDSNQAAIKEGMEMLTKAIDLRPDYDDAMAYLNLLYRERAEIECSDPASRAKDLQAADHWSDLVLSARKSKSEKTQRKQQPPPADRP